MKRYLIVLFTALLAFSCAKEGSSYIDLPSINEGFSFSADGGKSLGTVITNTKFEMVSDSPWCKVIIYEDNKSNNFRIDVEENLYAIKRKAVVTISAEGCENRTIVVRQSAAEPILSVDKTYFEFGKEAVSFPLEITSNVDAVISMPGWISMTEGAQIQMGRNVYNFYVEELDGVFREGSIILNATEYADMKKVVTVTQITGDLIIFEDDFSWAEGPALCHSSSGEKRWDGVTVDRPAWTTTIYTGAGSEDAPTPAAWTREGYIRMNYAKRPSNLVTPELTQVKGISDLVVSFRACRYQTSGGPDGYHEIHVSCLGPGTTSVDKFEINNCNNLSSDEAHWYALDSSLYTFKITGATAQTRVVFHFGPIRDAGDKMNENMSAIPPGEANSNCRMGFDDVKIKINVQ